MLIHKIVRDSPARCRLQIKKVLGFKHWDKGGRNPDVEFFQSLGSTGSLSCASTPNTHSCTRLSGSRSTNRWRASI